MAKRRNTVRSRRNTQSSSQPEQEGSSPGANLSPETQTQSQQQQLQQRRRRPRSNSNSNDRNRGTLANYAALIALALVIGSFGYYFQQFDGSTVAPVRKPRAPSLTRRTVPLPGDACNPQLVNSVCLYDDNDGYAFCNSIGRLERAGNAPTGQKCTDVVFGASTKGVSFIATGSVIPKDVGTEVVSCKCDPLTIDSVCLTRDTFAKCASDGKLVNMGSVAPGTSCSYGFTGGLARVVQVYSTPTNRRDSDMNKVLGWVEGTGIRATLSPGDSCGSDVTVCTGAGSALVCSGKVWKSVECSTCIQQDSTTAFKSDTCNY